MTLAALVALQVLSWSVVDGDTIKLNGEVWRLTGFDTPETSRARCLDEFNKGVAAASELSALLGTAHKLILIPEQHRDKYRRRLGSLIVDGRNVGLLLIAKNLARPYNKGRRQPWC